MAARLRTLTLSTGLLLSLSTTGSAAESSRMVPGTDDLPVWDGFTRVDCRSLFKKTFERLDAWRESGDPDFREPDVTLSCFTFPASRWDEMGRFYTSALERTGWESITGHLAIVYYGRDDAYLGLSFAQDWPEPPSLGSIVVFSVGGKDSSLAGAVDATKAQFGDPGQAQEEDAQAAPIPDSKGETKKPD